MGKSSKEKRDIYYRYAKTDGWRARSAYKLLEINDVFKIFENVERCVDLCAAPGSWSQVVQKEFHSKTEEEEGNMRIIERDPEQNDSLQESKKIIVAVDIQPMAPINDVIQLQGDITELSTAKKILEYFKGDKADLVICDGAPDVTGLHNMDEFLQSELVLAALNITLHILKDGGTLVAKVFRGRHISLLTEQLSLFFNNVTIFKPDSSRASSIESFVVCEKLKIPDNYTPSMESKITSRSYSMSGKEKTENKFFIDFLARGDLNSWSSDTNYSLAD
ncbi:hypothetical protein SNEBB_000213 [Seison nebaliae]|nr:hypothetical protein SNEBB_000213 [Seison nebaliae]